MKQMIPSSLQIKRSSLLLIAAFCFSISVFAQNANNGGVIAQNQAICPGATPAPFTSVTPASVTGDPSAVIEYMWMYGFSSNFSFLTFQPAPGINNQETYAAPGTGVTTYYIRCARRAGFTAFNAESNIVTVTVLNSPTAAINGAQNIFGGGSLNLSASPSPNTSFQWFNNGVLVGFGPNYTYNPGAYTGPVNITMVATNNATGCTATTTATFTSMAPTAPNAIDPCNCNDPLNIYTTTEVWNHDYILINSNPGETWFFTNTGGTTVADASLAPIPNGTIIPEIQPGVYYLDLWFVGVNGGWSGNVSNGLFNIPTGPGAASTCLPCFNPLPVEFTSFDATVEGKSVMLKWVTETETDNSHFEVERSIDGQRFEYVAKVQGAGTSTDINVYSYFVENPSAGEQYYRLKQVDFDGTFEYSSTRTVRISSDDAIVAIVPNPVKNNATIQFGDVVTPGTKIELLTTTGKIVQVLTATGSTNNIDMEHLPAGIYFLRVENSPRSDKAYFKVIKQ